MASKFLRRQTWWLKLRHPVSGTMIRHSLDTADSARAELLRQRIEVVLAPLQPWQFGVTERMFTPPRWIIDGGRHRKIPTSRRGPI